MVRRPKRRLFVFGWIPPRNKDRILAALSAVSRFDGAAEQEERQSAVAVSTEEELKIIQDALRALPTPTTLPEEAKYE